MRTVFRDAVRAFKAEALETVRKPLLWITGIAVPLFWCVMVAGVFSSGLMRDVPVALVDADNSAESRELVRALDSIPSVDFINYESPQAASSDLSVGNVYGMLVIGRGWAEKSAGSRADSALELYLNKSYYAIATTLETDIKTALATISAEKLTAAGAKTGGGFHGSSYRLKTVSSDILIAGNASLNFKAYLVTTLIPGVLAITAILTAVGALAREWRKKTVHTVTQTYESLGGFILGRLGFWCAVYSVFAVGYVSWFTGWQGWYPEGSLFLWVLGTVLFLCALPCIGAMFVSLSPGWILAMSVAIGTTAPVFPFTGFSFPIDSMDSLAQGLSYIFPLTWYLRIQSSQWVLASPLPHSLWLIWVMSLYVAVPLTVALIVLPRRMRNWAKAELTAKPAQQPEKPVTGFFATARSVIASGALNRDTFLIFVIAVAFYLCFYAWPYSAQSITSVHTAVVDLDRSATSRELIEKLKSLSAARITAVETDRARGEYLYKTEEVAAVITIPENFEADVLAGKHTFLALTANGAFPVKSRAVSAALTYVTNELTAKSFASNLARAGAGSSTLSALANRPVSLVDVNLFNPLSGYASYIVPLAAPVIVQAVMLVSIVISLGGWLASQNPPAVFQAVMRNTKGFAALWFAFWTFALFWLAYTFGPNFVFFDFASMQNPWATILLCVLYAGAIVGFGLAFTFAMNTNAYGAQFFVVISAPALFMSGTVHPVFDFNLLTLVARVFLPSTPGITGILAVAQNGAPLYAVMPQILHLIVLTAGYSAVAAWLWNRRRKSLANAGGAQ